MKGIDKGTDVRRGKNEEEKKVHREKGNSGRKMTERKNRKRSSDKDRKGQNEEQNGKRKE